MKNIVISSVVALLVLTGCSTKDASVSANQENGSVNSSSVNGNGALDSQSSSSSSSTSIASVEQEFASVYFDFDKFNINDDNKAKISSGVAIANTSASAYTIKLEGNCDEWGSDEYNFALGLKRANSVKKSLVAEGVDANRITMVSYGESNPACNEKTQECWAKNRRVDFKLLP